MENQSTEAHRDYRQSSEKFDYFITGVSIAICGYLVQTFDSHGLFEASIASKLEFCSICIFMLSVLFGLRRLEGVISGKRQNYSYLRENELISDISESAADGKTITIGGKRANKTDILQYIDERDERKIELVEELNKISDRNELNYKVRNFLFMLGIGVQLSAQVVLGAQ
jgi:hypothetical protein